MFAVCPCIASRLAAMSILPNETNQSTRLCMCKRDCRHGRKLQFPFACSYVRFLVQGYLFNSCVVGSEVLCCVRWNQLGNDCVTKLRLRRLHAYHKHLQTQSKLCQYTLPNPGNDFVAKLRLRRLHTYHKHLQTQSKLCQYIPPNVILGWKS